MVRQIQAVKQGHKDSGKTGERSEATLNATYKLAKETNTRVLALQSEVATLRSAMERSNLQLALPSSKRPSDLDFLEDDDDVEANPWPFDSDSAIDATLQDKTLKNKLTAELMSITVKSKTNIRHYLNAVINPFFPINLNTYVFFLTTCSLM